MRCGSTTCICGPLCPHRFNLWKICFVYLGEQQLFSSMGNWYLDYIELLSIEEVVPIHQDDVTCDELHGPW